MYQPNQRVTLDLSSLMIKGVFFSQNVQKAIGTIVQQVSTTPPVYLVELEIGTRPLISHCHLGLGKLYHRTDKREQARQHLTTAVTMYRDMGMTRRWESSNAIRSAASAAAAPTLQPSRVRSGLIDDP